MTLGASPPYVAFCDYYATGEGRTVIVALGPTLEDALRLFKERAPPFFVPSAELVELATDTRRIEKWLPPELLARAAFGPVSYFGLFQQNLA